MRICGFRTDRRQPFRYAPEWPTTGKVRVARNPPRTQKSGIPVSASDDILSRDRGTVWIPHRALPARSHTGDAISSPGGYVGGGLQMQVDAQIGPAGDVWVTNNWQYYPAALGKVDEALSTLGTRTRPRRRLRVLRDGEAGENPDDRTATPKVQGSCPEMPGPRGRDQTNDIVLLIVLVTHVAKPLLSCRACAGCICCS
jgi:hypothetical protein